MGHAITVSAGVQKKLENKVCVCVCHLGQSEKLSPHVCVYVESNNRL